MVQSLELALSARKSPDTEGAGWRAARSCAWLAENHPEETSREDFARKGVQIGEAALAVKPANVEPYYYQALNLGLLSNITGSGLSRIAPMKGLALHVIEIDERFAYGGGHRFLGVLCYRTSRIPFFAAGNAEDAERHLNRALELFPSHGDNLFKLAEFYVWNDAADRARELLEQLQQSPAPPDMTTEHAAWLVKGQELLSSLKD